MKKKVELVAIVEVDKDSRVQCQEPGCGKPIFQRIHVIRVEGKISVIGSTCFNKLYVDDRNEESEPTAAIYTGGASRKLTDEERTQLLENTERLIKKLEIECKESVNKNYTQRTSQPEKSDRSDHSANKISYGPERRVTCHYCRKPMLTRLTTAPAVGYKCATCKADRVPMPNRRNSWKTR